VLAVVAIVVFAGGGGDDNSSSDSGKTVAIKVANGKPVGGVQTIDVKQGDPVKFTVTADKGDEIHVHGYDLHKDIPANGGTVAFDFPAKMTGIFDVELEGPGQQIASLEVTP
jgi:FtsP/CotA-like multicopper oxidase with cupredoxin domain